MFSIVLSVMLALSAPLDVEAVVREDAPYLSADDLYNSVSGGDISAPDVSAELSALSEIMTAIDEKLEVVTAALDTSVDSYQVSEYYVNYFRGVLQNMPYTDYLCYAQRVQNGNYNNYITHYYLLYDLVLENERIVPGTYPCLDVYSYNNVYYVNETMKTFEGYPTMGYASFAPYSALVDRSFDYNSLYVGLISVVVFFLIARKTVFS